MSDYWKPLAFFLGGAVAFSFALATVLARINGESWTEIGNGLLMAAIVLPIIIAVALGLAEFAWRKWMA